MGTPGRQQAARRYAEARGHTKRCEACGAIPVPERSVLCRTCALHDPEAA